MANHRVTLEFEATTGNPSTAGSRAGWSETFYRKVDESDSDALAAARTLASRRRLLLTEGWSLSAIRVSRLDVNANLIRRGVLYLVPPADQPGRYNGGVVAAGVDEQPYDAIDLSINSVGGNHRAFLMRGIGNDVISPGGRFLNPVRWNTNWPDFWNFLINSPLGGPQAAGWSLRIRTQIFPVGIPSGRYPIETVDISNTSGLGTSPTRPAIKFGFVPNIIAGKTLVVQGVQGLRGINGTWLADTDATGVGTLWIVLKGKRNNTVAGTVVPFTGYALAYGYGLDTITSMTAGNGASRRTGRPLQLLRGRRSPRHS